MDPENELYFRALLSGERGAAPSAEAPPRSFIDRGLTGPEDPADLLYVGWRTARGRRAWEKHYGRDWPRVPETGERYHLHHKTPLADGGTWDVENIEPMHPAEHRRLHMEAGDHARWGGFRLLPKGHPAGGGGRILRAMPWLNALTSLTGILSGRIRTDTPMDFTGDMMGVPSLDDVRRINAAQCGIPEKKYKGELCT